MVRLTGPLVPQQDHVCAPQMQETSSKDLLPFLAAVGLTTRILFKQLEVRDPTSLTLASVVSTAGPARPKRLVRFC